MIRQNSQKKLKKSRVSVLILFLLVISLSIFLLSIWLSSETHQTILRIEALKDKEKALKNEISKLKIEATRLQSPENVKKIAEELDMIRVEEAPISIDAK